MRKGSWEPGSFKMANFSDDESTYEVEEILGVRKRGATIQYLVKWKGYGPDDNTWEPSKNLTDAKDAIEEFLRKQNEPTKSVVETKKTTTFTKIQRRGVVESQTSTSASTVLLSRSSHSTGFQQPALTELKTKSRILSLRSCFCTKPGCSLEICHGIVLLCFLFVFITFLVT